MGTAMYHIYAVRKLKNGQKARNYCGTADTEKEALNHIRCLAINWADYAYAVEAGSNLVIAATKPIDYRAGPAVQIPPDKPA